MSTEEKKEDRLALAITSAALEPDSAASLRRDFESMFSQFEEWEAKAKLIKVTSSSQKREMKLAKDSRLALRDIRVAADKTRKRLKEDSLRRGKAIDGIYNVLEAAIKPIETYLEVQENFAKREEQARKDALRTSREQTLRALGTDPAAYANLGELDEAMWTSVHDQAVAAKAAREEEARRQEQIRLEAERIAAEKREAERQAAVKAEAERKAREEAQAAENARLKKEAEEREAAQKAERERIEAERAKERAEAAAREKAAREAREAAEAQARAAQEAVERQRREEAGRIEAERAKAKAEADAREAAAKAERDALQAKLDEAQRAEEARKAAEAEAAKPTKTKYAELVAALNEIAAWHIDDVQDVDEPCSALRARAVLTKVGLGRAKPEAA